MTEKTLATFRVDAEQWQAFKAKAAENGVNATSLFLQWIEMYLDGNLDSTSQRIDGTAQRIDNNLDSVLSCIDERLDSAISPLQQQIDQLRSELGEFVA